MTVNKYGPSNEISEQVHKEKYRGENETFDECMYRIANELKEDDDHYHRLTDILLNMRFLPAGRIQNAVGSTRKTTPGNCYVSRDIQDDSNSIMKCVGEAFQTMRLGGGIGYDFSLLRPRGDRIKSLDSVSSGPVSFMGIFNATCATVCSAGHRRGAQMGVMRIDHPDIEEFIASKQNSDSLTNFNISIGVTDEFMTCLKEKKPFDLKFEGKVYKTIDPEKLWDKIMRSTWDWAEPGVLYIDRINKKNNLWYCETIRATNPCGCLSY